MDKDEGSPRSGCFAATLTASLQSLAPSAVRRGAVSYQVDDTSAGLRSTNGGRRCLLGQTEVGDRIHNAFPRERIEFDLECIFLLGCGNGPEQSDN